MRQSYSFKYRGVRVTVERGLYSFWLGQMMRYRASHLAMKADIDGWLGLQRDIDKNYRTRLPVDNGAARD